MKKMKQKLIFVLCLALVSAMLLSACSSTSTKSTTTETTTDTQTETDTTETQDTEETTDDTQLANPWTESDEAGVAEATGFDLAAPEGAEDVAYSYMSEGALAQLTYTLDGANWIYRVQMADEMTDISGLQYTWMSGNEGTVSNRTAMYYGYNMASNDGTEIVQLVNWYDAVVGATYSLSATGKELSDAEMQTYAESIYAPAQGDATGDAEADREAELSTYFVGEHTRSSDESTLTITENEDGSFGITLNVVRLCTLESSVGTYENHRITFTAEDPSGNDLTAVIYLSNDNSLTVEVTDSTWEYLPNGELLEGFGK